MTQSLTIMTGVPLPPVKKLKRRTSKYDILRAMCVGDCITFENDKAAKNAYQWKTKNLPDVSFARREVDDGKIGLWRIK